MKDRQPISWEDRRLHPRAMLPSGQRVAWLDAEGELVGWWLDFSPAGARMAWMGGSPAPKVGMLIQGWAADPSPSQERQFLALDLRISWRDTMESDSSDEGLGTVVMGCRFERLGMNEKNALQSMASYFGKKFD